MTDNTKTISTINDFLRALGGNAELIKRLGVKRNTIAQWRLRNHIATGFHLRLFSLAKQKNIDFCPTSIFGLDPEDAQVLLSHNTIPYNHNALPQNVIRLVANKS